METINVLRDYPLENYDDRERRLNINGLYFSECDVEGTLYGDYHSKNIEEE